MTINMEHSGEISDACWKTYSEKPIGTDQNLVFNTNGNDQVQLIKSGALFAVVSLIDGSVPKVLPFSEATQFAEMYVSEMYEGPLAN
jgi:hypothetical protein